MANAQWNTNTNCSVQIASVVWTTQTFRSPACNLEISMYTVSRHCRAQICNLHTVLKWVLAYHFFKRESSYKL